MSDEDREVVWVAEFHCYGFLINRGAHYSTVFMPGIGEECIANDEYEFWVERAIEDERDE